MKTIVSSLCFVIALFVSLNAESQNPDRFPKLHERIVQAKLHEIRLHLNLDQATFDRFRPIYLKYEREISGLDFRNLAKMMKIDADSLSSKEAEGLIVSQLEAAKKLISIREKYYSEFKSVISPQQIIKLYQTEFEIRKKVIQELKRRMKNR